VAAIMRAGTAVVLREAEGGERESPESLRDALHGAAAPAAGPEPSLTHEILKCPTCDAAQVPIDEPVMTCQFCSPPSEM
jgi:hypothetical protein